MCRLMYFVAVQEDSRGLERKPSKAVEAARSSLNWKNVWRVYRSRALRILHPLGNEAVVFVVLQGADEVEKGVGADRAVIVHDSI